MSDYKNNPLFKAILQEISSNATTGRIDLDWKKVSGTTKKLLKEQAEDDTKKPTDVDEKPEPEAPKGNPFAGAKSNPAGGKPSTGAPEDEKPTDAGAEEAPEKAPKAPPEAAPEPEGDEEVDQAKEDALKAKAELEKAKAEKGEAEDDLKNQSYIHLNSNSGVGFLLGKLVDQAFKTNTIDSLASEMVGKLNIKASEQYQAFSAEMIPFKNIPGVAELLSSMSGLIGKEAPTEA